MICWMGKWKRWRSRKPGFLCSMARYEPMLFVKTTRAVGVQNRGWMSELSGVSSDGSEYLMVDIDMS